jgi:signal transduction histidine kinase
MSSPDYSQILKELHTVLQRLRSAAELDQTLQQLVIAAATLTDSEAGSILRYDPDSNRLLFVAAPWFQQGPHKQVSIPVEGSMAGWAFSNRETLVVQNTETDPRHFRAVDLATNFKTTSLLAVPLIFQGGATGVLEVLNKANNAHYTEVDVTILELLASYISLALLLYYPKPQAESALDEITELNRLRKNIIAITSHELRTPLGLILGHATFLREMINEEFREPMDVIINNAIRLKEIVEDLTDVDNYESGLARLRKRPVAISRMVLEILSSFKGMASSKNITLQSEVAEDPVIEIDENKMTVAISNLLRNALTFTDSGGEVNVKVELIPGYVQVTVQDTGIGIPAKDLQNVFERFYQIESHLTRRHGGMGLGLSVAKSMVEMHGGRIWAESVEGRGSKFFVNLPFPNSSMDNVEKGSNS